MSLGSYRLKVSLDAEQGAKLQRLARRMQENEGTVARLLLSRALEDADADLRHIAELLDGVDGAYERAQLGLEQARAGRTLSLNEL